MNKRLLLIFGTIVLVLPFLSSVLYDNFDDNNLNISAWKTQNATTGGGVISFEEVNQHIEMGVEMPAASQTSIVNLTSVYNFGTTMNWTATALPGTSGFGGAGKWSYCGVENNGNILVGSNRSQALYVGNYTDSNWTIYHSGATTIIRNSTHTVRTLGYLVNGTISFACRGQTSTGSSGVTNQTIDTIIGDFAVGTSFPATITLLNPSNASFQNGNLIKFNATVEPSIFNVTNVSLLVWYSNGSLFNLTSNQTINSNSNFNVTYYMNNFTGGNYIWNVESCAGNYIGINCTRKTSNNTFTWTVFTENSQSYHYTTIEGNQELFEINVSYNTSYYPNVIPLLFYNGTSYFGNKYEVGNYLIFNKSLTIPEISNSSVNLTFYWNFEFVINSILSDFYNGTIKQQTISTVLIDDCSVYSVLLLNYTLKDEDTQVIITPTANTTIEIDLDVYSVGGTTSIFNFSKSYTGVNKAAVCINSALVNSTYEMDVKTKYKTDLYQTEYNNIQRYILNASTVSQNISLLDLLTTQATTFQIIYKDSSLLPLEGALIDIARSYIAEGQFKTVEKPITGLAGRTTASLVRDIGIYNIYVYKDGELLSTFQNVIPVCQNVVTGECTITLNALSSVTSPSNFQTINNIYYTFSYESVNRIGTLEFTTVDGSSSTIELNGTLFTAYLNETVCYDSLTSSSGTLTCTIPASYVNQTVYMYIYKNGEILEIQKISLLPNPRSYFGSGIIAIFYIIIIMTVPLFFITSLIGMVVGGLIGVFFFSLIFMLNGFTGFNISTSFIWLVLVVALLLWKLNDRGDST